MRSNSSPHLGLHLGLGLGLLCLGSTRALGFGDANQFFANPDVPAGAAVGAEGDGVYFTGAPRFAGRTCADCHVDGALKLGLQLGADPQSLFTSGYLPGQTYELQVTLQNEHQGTQYGGATCTTPPGVAGSYSQCNDNGFALELDAAGAPLTKGLCAAAPVAGACPAPDSSNDEALVAPGGDAVFANLPLDPDTAHLQRRNGARSWRFWWTAPSAGSGPVTIYSAAVDGNGGGGRADLDQDPYGDDTVAATFFIQEQGAPASTSAHAGCSVGAGAGSASWWGLGGLAALLLARRRKAT